MQILLGDGMSLLQVPEKSSLDSNPGRAQKHGFKRCPAVRKIPKSSLISSVLVVQWLVRDLAKVQIRVRFPFRTPYAPIRELA